VSDRRLIPLYEPDLGEAETRAAARAIRSGWVAQGPEVEAFEREFTAFCGAPEAVAISNGTAALALALAALGVGAGDEVITVSLSFIATANAVRATGARAVFVDIDPATLNIDPAQIEPAISPRTRALLVVHQVGMPCELAAILPIARRHGLALVEDAACAAGSEIRMEGAWARIGAPHGDAACFSFHARKPITTGEGGMITVRDAAVAARLRLMRNHGMSVSPTERHRAAAVTFEDYEGAHLNHRLSDIAGAVGRAQLERLADMVARRRRLAARYAERLAQRGVATPLREPAWARSNWQSYPVTLPAYANQRAVMQHMLDVGVATRRGIMCAHLTSAWPAGAWTCGPRGLVESERARDRQILLPFFPTLTEDEQERVVAALEGACA
jgi:perosamine synthetase